MPTGELLCGENRLNIFLQCSEQRFHISMMLFEERAELLSLFGGEIQFVRHSISDTPPHFAGCIHGLRLSLVNALLDDNDSHAGSDHPTSQEQNRAH